MRNFPSKRARLVKISRSKSISLKFSKSKSRLQISDGRIFNQLWRHIYRLNKTMIIRLEMMTKSDERVVGQQMLRLISPVTFHASGRETQMKLGYGNNRQKRYASGHFVSLEKETDCGGNNNNTGNPSVTQPPTALSKVIELNNTIWRKYIPGIEVTSWHLLGGGVRLYAAPLVHLSLSCV